MYASLMIDLKKSRSYSLEDREALQYYIIKVCDVLNAVFQNVLERKVEFSAGDEIQGLFLSPSAAYLYYRLFCMLIFPVETRAGIGCGSWEVQIEGSGTTAQDGLVYHNARYAIVEAEEVEEYAVLYYSGTGGDILVNSLISAAARLTEKMSIYQNEVMLLTELLSPINAGNSLDLSGFPYILDLLTFQKTIKFYASKRKNERGTVYLYDADNKFPFAAYPVDADCQEKLFYITGGRQRGVPSKLAEVLNISRQSVEKTLKTANIYTARNMAITALKVMSYER